MYPFLSLMAVVNRKPHPRLARSALSFKESVWVFFAGTLAFGGIALAFWLAARSALV